MQKRFVSRAQHVTGWHGESSRAWGAVSRGGRLWILGMKNEKIGRIIETTQGGITDAAGIFIYSNQGWDETVPAFLIDNSTVTLAGIFERNFNRRPISFWVQETQNGETRQLREHPSVYLSH